MELGALTWTEVERPLLAVPVGSCEQHGPHLPLHTDTVIAEALAADLAARRDDCLVAPSVTFSASGEHAGFPGTLSIGTEATAELVVELARSAEWAAGTVFVNGHGGNAAAMELAAARCRDEGRKVLIWWPSLPDADLHAGRTETSLMLALAPQEVRMERAVAGPIPALADLVRLGVKRLSESGVLGDPGEADAEAGVAIFRQLADQLATAVAGWAR